MKQPMGVSQWKKYGKKYGYWKYFGKDQRDEMVEKVICGPGDSIYIPSMEPHGMKNASKTEPGTFLCCICNVYEDKTI